MDSVIFARLVKYLNSSFENESWHDDIVKCVTAVVQFVEMVSPSMKLQGDEKHELALSWVQKLVPSISVTELNLVSDFINVIVLASKGFLNLNKQSQKSLQPAKSEPSTKPEPTVPTETNVASEVKTPQPAPKPKPKFFSLSRKNRTSCFDADV